MSNFNRLFNVDNPAQGRQKRVLCVCSAGLLRSPTAAVVLAAEPFNYNTRAAGAEDSYALIPVDEVLVAWAEEIVCMTPQHKAMLMAKFPDIDESTILVLDIPDDFRYRDKRLMTMIASAYNNALRTNPSATNRQIP